MNKVKLIIGSLFMLLGPLVAIFGDFFLKELVSIVLMTYGFLLYQKVMVLSSYLTAITVMGMLIISWGMMDNTISLYLIGIILVIYPSILGFIKKK